MSSWKSALKKLESNQSISNYYPFYKMNVGDQAIVRFLPDLNKENPFEFFVEKYTHTLNVGTETKTVPCLFPHKKACPICDLSASWYKKEGKTSVNGKKYWRTRSRISQVLVMSDCLPLNANGENFEGKVCLFNISYQLFEVIRNSADDFDDDSPPFHYKNGTDFIIKKTQQGEYVTYATGSKFARKSTPLDDETIAYIEENLIDLSTQLPAEPSVSELNKLLKAEANDEHSDENEEVEVDDEPVVLDRTTTKKKETKPVLDEEDDDEDLSGDDILATIRRGRK